MATHLTGIAIRLRDPAKTTPFKQVQVTGMSFSVSLRTLDLYVYRYDAAQGLVPLSVGVTVRLLTSNQADTLSTDAAGHLQTVFPDATIEVRLTPADAPAGHQAILNYPIKTQKKNRLYVIFIPDSLRRYYPQLQLLSR